MRYKVEEAGADRPHSEIPMSEIGILVTILGSMDLHTTISSKRHRCVHRVRCLPTSADAVFVTTCS